MKTLRWLLWGTTGLAVSVASLLFILHATAHTQTQVTQYQSNTATYNGTRLTGVQTPSVTLIDQHGRPVKLDSFKGKVVVLSFLDTRCKDVCPITAEELVQSYHSLDTKAKDVVFVGINVNAKYNRVQDVMKFSKEHKLTQIPDWHYLTGDPKTLEKVWKTYYMEVSTSSGGDINHTSAFYIIGQNGETQWLINNSGESQSPADYSKLITKHVLELLGK